MYTVCLIKLSSIYFMTFQKGYVYLHNINVRLAIVTLYALDKKGNLCTNSLTKTLILSMVLLSGENIKLRKFLATLCCIHHQSILLRALFHERMLHQQV